MNNFICTSQGFFTGFKTNEDFTWTPLFSHTLREAKQLRSKEARTIIQKHKIDGFVWNPYIEEPIRNQYKVVRRQNHHDFFSDEYHETLEWLVVPVKMESNTDVEFLLSKGKVKSYLSKEAATELALERNTKALEELKNKIEKLKV